MALDPELKLALNSLGTKLDRLFFLQSAILATESLTEASMKELIDAVGGIGVDSEKIDGVVEKIDTNVAKLKAAIASDRKR